jgi:peptidyl-prolyl cis-trans isomerase SurA
MSATQGNRILYLQTLWRILILCLLGAIGSVAAQGEEIDRLLVAVNGKVITDGDLKLSRSLNVIISPSQRPVSDSAGEELSRLIDLELMRQELQNFSMAQEDERDVESRLQSLRDTYAKTGGLAVLLQRLGLQESELISYLRLESSIMKFVNFRFRPFVTVTGEEIKSYYEKRLAPQLQKSNLELLPLMQVSTRIEEILREEKINEALDRWIREIRRTSQIEYFSEQGVHGEGADKAKGS